MRNKILIFISFILLAGCDFDCKQPQAFRWAFVDKNKVQNAIADDFKNNNPYPEEMKNIDEKIRDRSNLRDQISDLERSGERKCKASVSPETGAKPQKILDNAENTVMDVPHIESIEDWHRERRVEKSPAYQDCMDNIKKDPLIMDLKDTAQKLEDMHDAKRKHDDAVKKELTNTINSTVAMYAEKNGYELIISNPSNDNVMYSKNKAVVDVTADIIDHIQKNMDANTL